jgi:hypothetical protein
MTLCEDCADFDNSCLTCGSIEILHRVVDKQKKKLDTYIDEKKQTTTNSITDTVVNAPIGATRNFFSLVGGDRVLFLFSVFMVIYMIVACVFQFFLLKNVYGDCSSLLPQNKEFVFRAYDKI